MKLSFELNNCLTTFSAFEMQRKNEVVFEAKPTTFTITTHDGFVLSPETKGNDNDFQIELVICVAEFEDGVHGYLTSFSAWGINIALACSQQQMTELNNFIVNKIKPKLINISIEDSQLVSRNFKMEKSQYKIAGWDFKL